MNFVPTNIMQAMSEGSMVPCIVFSLLFGVGMGTYTKQTGNKHIADWVKGINAVVTNIIKTVMNIAPIGIFCLLENVAGTTGFKVIIPMMKFLGLLLIGDAIQFVLFAPLTAVLCKINVFKMPKKFAKMSMMAVTTTSGAIGLPTKMENAVTKFGVSRKVADFTGPITMSMNSCGAEQCYVAAIYGTGNWYKYDSLSNGNGNSSVMLNVYGNNFSTGRLGYCIYFFSILSWITVRKYCCADWYRLVCRNVPYINECRCYGC